MNSLTESFAIRLRYPEWRGGVNRNYVIGERIMDVIVPAHDGSRTIDVPVNTDFDQPNEPLDGFDYGAALLETTRAATKLLEDADAARVLTIGGDCSVSQAPFAYLAQRYGNGFGVLWIDAHPDISLVNTTSHFHETPVANLLGLNQECELTCVPRPMDPAHVFLAGLVESGPYPHDHLTENEGKVEELNIAHSGPVELNLNTQPVTAWIKRAAITHLAVHWDLDSVEPHEFRSVYPANPDQRLRDFFASVGALRLKTVQRLLAEVQDATDVVALTVAEHLPWDAINLCGVLDGAALRF